MKISRVVILALLAAVPLPAFAEALPRIDFHKKCEIFYLLGDGSVVTPDTTTVTCDGIDMQKRPHAKAWRAHLKSNRFKELPRIVKTVWDTTFVTEVFENEKPVPYSAPTAARPATPIVRLPGAQDATAGDTR